MERATQEDGRKPRWVKPTAQADLVGPSLCKYSYPKEAEISPSEIIKDYFKQSISSEITSTYNFHCGPLERLMENPGKCRWSTAKEMHSP